MIDESARVADDTVLGTATSVGAFCVIGHDGAGDPVRIGDRGTVRSHVVIYRDTTIGSGFHAAHHVVIRETTRIGDNVSVGTHCVIEHHVAIADGVRLHSRCFVPELSVLEEGAWLGPGVILTNARYPNRPDTKANLEGVRVGANARLGAGAVVLPGVHIGADAMIGAGAVVVSDVAPGRTMVGNPAREVG